MVENIYEVTTQQETNNHHITRKKENALQPEVEGRPRTGRLLRPSAMQ